MYQLKIISSSTRPGRKGPLVAGWVLEQVVKHGRFNAELIDLGELKLPLMDEEAHPAEQVYKHEHTKKWSKVIEEADAFVFVTAEYNFNYPAPLKNALDYLFNEWNYKPAGIVCYGGVSGGTRAANRLKGDLSSYKMMPLSSIVPFPFFSNLINDQGVFVPQPRSEQSVAAMLDELHEAAQALLPMRK